MSKRLEEIVFDCTWTQVALAMYGAIQASSRKDITLVDVMGYTGHAFRMTIHEETVDVAGPTEFDWGTILPKGLRNLGFATNHLGEPNFQAPTPEELTKAISLIQESIDKEMPVIGWDLFVPEFGLIYGYDDEKQLLKAKDTSKQGELAYEKLGRGEIGELFVMAISESDPVDRYSSLQGALQMILDHAYNRQRDYVREPFKCGLAGYDAWTNAFANRKVDAFGNSYNIQHVSCARDFAWKFLHTLSHDWDIKTGADKKIQSVLSDAADYYGKVADALKPLADLFPFPHGGEPNSDENIEIAIQQITEAKQSEEKGIQALESIYHLLNDVRTKV